MRESKCIFLFSIFGRHHLPCPFSPHSPTRFLKQDNDASEKANTGPRTNLTRGLVSSVAQPRKSAELKDNFLSHCSQISAGDHMQIIGDPIGAVVACVASVSSRGSFRKLGQEQKNIFASALTFAQ